MPTLTPRHPLYERALAVAKLYAAGRPILEICGDVWEAEGAALNVRVDFRTAAYRTGTGLSGRLWVGTGEKMVWEDTPHAETPDHPFHRALVSSMARRLEVPECEVGAHVADRSGGGSASAAWLKRPIEDIDRKYWPLVARVSA